MIGIPYIRDNHDNLVYRPRIIFGDAEHNCLFEMNETGLIHKLPPIHNTNEIKLIGSKYRSQRLNETLALISPNVLAMGGCGNKFVRLL